MISAVIMAGGRGERFWPKSRNDNPKQFLNLVGEGTMLQQTVARIEPLIAVQQVFVSTAVDYVAKVREQLPELPVGNIIIEPMGRDTAAGIGFAALHLERLDPQGIMVVLPADHLITGTVRYIEVLETAVAVAKREDCAVTIGIQPTRPDTGYGYINFGGKAKVINGNPVYKALAFTEKPNLERAQDFLMEGSYLWNSGMFVWKLATIRKLIAEHMPQLHLGLEKIKAAFDTPKEEKVTFEVFQDLKKISVDFGIMEKADKVYVVPGDFGWDDIGSWPALARVLPVDKENNLLLGRVVARNTRDCVIESPNKLMATVGINGLVIIDTTDAMLICPKDKVSEIKFLLQTIQEKSLKKYL